MDKWTILAPNHGAIEIYAHNEKNARESARYILGLKKLPKGTWVWKLG